MTFTAWLSLFAVSLLGAASPGPSLGVVVKNTLGGNKINGIVTAWSHAMGIGVYATLTMLGLAIILKENPTVFKVIAYIGALYLIWLGIGALRATGGIAKKLEKGEKTTYKESARDGIMISIFNPKIGLFFIALFSQFMHTDIGLSGQIITVLTPFCTDGLWYTFIAFILSNSKVLEFLRKKASVIDKIMGILFIIIALKILFVN